MFSSLFPPSERTHFKQTPLMWKARVHNRCQLICHVTCYPLLYFADLLKGEPRIHSFGKYIVPGICLVFGRYHKIEHAPKIILRMTQSVFTDGIYRYRRLFRPKDVDDDDEINHFYPLRVKSSPKDKKQTGCIRHYWEMRIVDKSMPWSKSKTRKYIVEANDFSCVPSVPSQCISNCGPRTRMGPREYMTKVHKSVLKIRIITSWFLCLVSVLGIFYFIGFSIRDSGAHS